MKALSKIRALFISGGKLKPLPIVAVIVDCLIVGGILFSFVKPHQNEPVAAAPEVVGAQHAQNPNVKPHVLGQNTTQAAPPAVAGAVKPAQATIAAIVQAADTAPITATQPTEIASITPATDPSTSTGPATEQPATTPTETTPAGSTTTETTPALTDFVTVITQAGQVAPGTLISYNSAKGEKAYYGGDLVLSPSSITISRSAVSGTPAALTVSVPDGIAVNTPSSTGGANVPAIGMDAATAVATGTTFNMIVSLNAAPNGTYTLHLSTFRTGQAADAWQYDGFITVTVTD